jgi:hypothetical protein
MKSDALDCKPLVNCTSMVNLVGMGSCSPGGHEAKDKNGQVQLLQRLGSACAGWGILGSACTNGEGST